MIYLTHHQGDLEGAHQVVAVIASESNHEAQFISTCNRCPLIPTKSIVAIKKSTL